MIKTDKIIYRTRTQVEYNWLMEKLEEAGCEWSSGYLPTEVNYWRRYFTETCINFNDDGIIFANFDFYKNKSDYKDYEIIEVSDLIENEKKTEILEKLKTLDEHLTNKLENLEKENDESQTIKKVVYTTEVYFE